MLESLLQQSLNLGGGVVFIPLAFGLAVGLGYVIISAARHKKGTWIFTSLQTLSCCFVISIMSIEFTNRAFIKDVFVVVTVVTIYIIGALLTIDYFPHWFLRVIFR
jgi:hypothetical protein